MTEIWVRVQPTEPTETLSACALRPDLNWASSTVEMQGSIRLHRPEEPCTDDVLGLYPKVRIHGYTGDVKVIRSDLVKEEDRTESDEESSIVQVRGRFFVNPEHEYFSLTLNVPEQQYARIVDHAHLGCSPIQILVRLAADDWATESTGRQALITEYDIQYCLDRVSNVSTRGRSQNREASINQSVAESVIRYIDTSQQSIQWQDFRDSQVRRMFAQLLHSAGHRAYSLALPDDERDMLFRDSADICKTLANAFAEVSQDRASRTFFWRKKSIHDHFYYKGSVDGPPTPETRAVTAAVWDYLNQKLASPLFEWACVDAICYQAFLDHLQKQELQAERKKVSWVSRILRSSSPPVSKVDALNTVYEYISTSTPPGTVRRLLEQVSQAGVSIEGTVFSLLIWAEHRKAESWWIGALEAESQSKIEKAVERHMSDIV